MKTFTDALTKKRISYNIKVDNWNITADDVTMDDVDKFDADYREVESVSKDFSSS